MFEFFESLQFGKEINAHGGKWQSVKILQNRYHIAVRINDKLPIQCFVVQEDEVPKKDSSNVQIEARHAFVASLSNAGLGPAKGEK